MKITRSQADQLIKICKKYKKETSLSKANKWKEYDNNDVWNKIVEQVMVVGGTSCLSKFRAKKDLQKKLQYTSLIGLDDDQRTKDINAVLREIDSSYSNSDYSKCAK